MASTSQQATVQDASLSPPPLPNEPLPTIRDSAPVVDQPIESLGDDDGESEDDDSDDEWDPADQRGPGEVRESTKVKEVSTGEDQPWQAVWALEQNGQSLPYITMAKPDFDYSVVLLELPKWRSYMDQPTQSRGYLIFHKPRAYSCPTTASDRPSSTYHPRPRS